MMKKRLWFVAVLLFLLLLPALAAEDAGEAEPSGDNEIYVQEKDTELTEPSPDPTAEPPAEPTEAPAEAPGEEPSPEPTEVPEADPEADPETDPGEVRRVTITWQVTDAEFTQQDVYVWNPAALRYELQETVTAQVPAQVTVTVHNGLETAVSASLSFTPAEGVQASLTSQPVTVPAESEGMLSGEVAVSSIEGLAARLPGETEKLTVGAVTVTVTEAP